MDTIQHTESLDELRAQLFRMGELNQQMDEMMRRQQKDYRRAIEELLMIFAAKGYKPAARALLVARKLFNEAEKEDVQ